MDLPKSTYYFEIEKEDIIEIERDMLADYEGGGNT